MNRTPSEKNSRAWRVLNLMGSVWIVACLSGCQPNDVEQEEGKLLAIPRHRAVDNGDNTGNADNAAIRATERTPMTVGGNSAGAASISTDGHEPSSSSGGRMEVRLADPSSADPRTSSPRRATPPASKSDRKEVKADDPNTAKIEGYVSGWLSSEHKDEIESFIIRGREETTFKADRYYTFITTVDEHSYNVTVDVYHDGRIRLFKSEKLY
ncbi:MAG: hypothetical protein Q8M16_10830 [Pirellulaceae bacterium]|nr:hypothetical protein [Pirellulaceae bacterium]